jgi:hypothetical protein
MRRRISIVAARDIERSEPPECVPRRWSSIAGTERPDDDDAVPRRSARSILRDVRSIVTHSFASAPVAAVSVHVLLELSLVTMNEKRSLAATAAVHSCVANSTLALLRSALATSSSYQANVPSCSSTAKRFLPPFDSQPRLNVGSAAALSRACVCRWRRRRV